MCVVVGLYTYYITQKISPATAYTQVRNELNNIHYNSSPKVIGWFVWFYGISTLAGYSTPNPFLCK